MPIDRSTIKKTGHNSSINIGAMCHGIANGQHIQPLTPDETSVNMSRHPMIL